VTRVSTTSAAPTRAAAARRPAERPAAVIESTPDRRSAMTTLSPIEPTPYTSAVSPGPTSASRTAFNATASGSAHAPHSTGTPSGSATSCAPGTATYCAYAPGAVIPMFGTGHPNGTRRAHARHSPHDPSGLTATAAPTRHPVVPPSTTRPASSCPRI
jgi:hypothetical protein